MQPKFKPVFIVVLLVIIAFAQPSSSTQKKSVSPYFNRLIIQFKNGVNSKTISKVISKTATLTKAQKLNSKIVYTIKPKKNIKDTIAYLKKSSVVKYVSKDYRRKLFYTPSDPSYSKSQWSLDSMKVNYAWNKGETDGWLNNNITVAVIDAGIDTDHADLASNIWVNTDETASNSVDDDGNGFIDDRNGYSWGAISNYSLTIDNVTDFLKYLTSYDFGGSYPVQKLQTFAQSITGTGGKIKSLSFAIGRTGTPKDITVSLKSNTGGKPGTTLASFTLKSSDVLSLDLDSANTKKVFSNNTSDVWAEKSFDDAITLTNGETYFIVLSTTNSSSSSYYSIYLNTGYDYFTNGNLFTSRKAGSNEYWTEQAKTDLLFLSDATGSDISDDYDHGSAVSGIIGAVHNSIGGSGIVPAVKIMPLKVDNDSGYISDSAIIEAINYAVDNGAKIINMSLGSPDYSAALEEATNYAFNNGVLVVSSAGNDGMKADNYPASNKNVLSVGATSDDGDLAYFSTLSDYVDIVAPGEDIYSTNKDGDYGAFAGTSASSPQIAGAAALLKLSNPLLTPEAISSRLTNTATDLGSIGRDSYYGYGEINLENVLASTSFSKFSVSANTGYVYYGNDATITATLNVGSWPPSTNMSGATIKGSYKSDSFPLWLPFMQKKTNSSGKIKFSFTPLENTDIRLDWVGSSSYQRATTELTLHVRPEVAMGLKRSGNNAIVFGSVKPNLGGRIGFYRSKNRRSWHKISTIKLDKKSNYELLFKPRKGKYFYRTLMPEDEGYALGKSLTKALVGN